jgi:hypothetical protein
MTIPENISLIQRGRHLNQQEKEIFIKPLTKDFREKLCSDELVGRAEI